MCWRPLPDSSLGYDIYEDIGLLYIRGQGEITQHQRMSAMLAWLREPEKRCSRRTAPTHESD
jgi:hypothetical protein